MCRCVSFLLFFAFFAIFTFTWTCLQAGGAAETAESRGLVEYEVRVELRNRKAVAFAEYLGLEKPAIGRRTYRVLPEVYFELNFAGIDCRLVGGVSELLIGPGNVSGPPTAKHRSEMNPAPQETFLDSGDVFFDIPDGTGEIGYYSMTSAGAPAWATVTGVEFSTLIEGYGEWTFSCYDFQLALFHETPGEDYIFWLHFGDLFDGSDDGWDDDPENDWDIYIEDWYTNSFNGQNPNGDWGLSCFDTVAGDAGWMR